METVAYLITAISTFALAVYAAIQLSLFRRQTKLIHEEIYESKKSRDAEVILYLMKHMHGFRDKWHQVYKLSENHESWIDEQRILADDVCVKLQEAAFLGLTGLFEHGYLMDCFAPTFIRCWSKLENYVRDYRERCDEPCTIEEGAFQRKHFEIFARECEEYLKKYHPKIFEKLLRKNQSS